MHRSEPEFCREQAERLLALAKECTDAKVRDHLAMMANDWLDRAKAKENLPKTA
jgi:HEPN domain-containing protein